MTAAAVVVLAFIVLLVIYVALAIKIVQQYEQGLIERFGRYRKTVDPGFHMIVPFIERMVKVDMREQVVDVPPQEVITRDNVVVTVDAVVYYQATDPVKLKYNVSNFILAATKLAQTNLRNVVGDMDLDDALTSARPSTPNSVRSWTKRPTCGVLASSVSRFSGSIPRPTSRRPCTVK